MSSEPDFERCLHFINSQAWSSGRVSLHETHGSCPPSVTISRQTGSGAHSIAAILAKDLQRRLPGEAAPWAVFDRNLVERVLEEHNLPNRFARFMPEDGIPELAEAFDELLGFRPPSRVLVQQTTQTILRLARRGNVILIGRAAHVITRELSQVFHVRLVGSLEKRVEYVQKTRGLTRKEAETLVLIEDRGRQRYLRKYFGRDSEDPLSYHLVVNTDSLHHESAACLIADAALSHFKSRAPVATPQ